MGFDDRFIRMWDYYLSISEAGFRTGMTQDLQIAFEKATRRLLRSPPCASSIVGASGYVGSRLAARLLESGHAVRLASRDPRGLAERFPGADVVPIDLLEPATLPAAVEGVELAYYLAHSMAGGEADFEERDRRRCSCLRPRCPSGRCRSHRLPRWAGRPIHPSLAASREPPARRERSWRAKVSR